MIQIFTKEWVELLGKEVLSVFENFKWRESSPENSLDITYRIELKGSDIFSYHLQCRKDGIQIVLGEPDGGSSTKNVTFTQSEDVALGLMQGELDSHIEFLMGRIQVQGDVLVLDEYSEVLEKLGGIISSLNSQLGGN